MKLVEFDLDVPRAEKAVRHAYREESRSVTSLYERCIPGLKVKRGWKVLVECVPGVEHAGVRDLLGVPTPPPSSSTALRRDPRAVRRHRERPPPLQRQEPMADHLEISDNEFAAVSQLDAVARYRHFLKCVADWREAWGLYEDGWMSLHDDERRILLPLWPARRYAEAYRSQDWAQRAEARAIPLIELLEEWLPGLTRDGRGIAVFPVTSVTESIHPSPADFERDLREELLHYE